MDITTTDIIYILDDSVEVTVEFDIELELVSVSDYSQPEGVGRETEGVLAGWDALSACKLDDANTEVDINSISNEIKDAMADFDVAPYVNAWLEKEAENAWDV